MPDSGGDTENRSRRHGSPLPHGPEGSLPPSSRLGTPGSTQAAGHPARYPASTCIVRRGVRGQRLIRGGPVGPRGRRASRLHILGRRRLLLGRGQLAVRGARPPVRAARFAFSVCKGFCRQPGRRALPGSRSAFAAPAGAPHTAPHGPRSTAPPEGSIGHCNAPGPHLAHHSPPASSSASSQP